MFSLRGEKRSPITCPRHEVYFSFNSNYKPYKLVYIHRICLIVSNTLHMINSLLSIEDDCRPQRERWLSSYHGSYCIMADRDKEIESNDHHSCIVHPATFWLLSDDKYTPIHNWYAQQTQLLRQSTCQSVPKPSSLSMGFRRPNREYNSVPQMTAR